MGAAIFDAIRRRGFCQTLCRRENGLGPIKEHPAREKLSEKQVVRRSSTGASYRDTKEHRGASSIGSESSRGDWTGPEWAGAVSSKRLGQEQNGCHFWARLWLSFMGPCPRGVTPWGARVLELK